MAVPPMLFEGALLAITLLLAVLAAIRRVSSASGLPALSPRPDCGCICDYASSVSD